MSKTNKNFYKIFKIIVSCLLIYAIYQVIDELYIQYKPLFENSTRLPLSLFILIMVVFIIVIFIFLNIWCRDTLMQLFRVKIFITWLRKPLVTLIAVGISLLIFYSPLSFAFTGWWFRSFLLFSTIFFMTWLLTINECRLYSFEAFLVSSILLSSIYILASELQTSTNYPFSIGWSEGNRLYDYSLLYGSTGYNYPSELQIPALISTGRQALWGLPFLIPNVSIFTVRLWNIILFSIPYFLLGVFIFSKKEKKSTSIFLASLWTFLFLRQGPIYAPLVLAAILVVIASKVKWWLGMILVAIAAYYMRDSRFTWVFAPAMWAIMITFLEKSPNNVNNDKQRLIRALLFGAAGIIGMLLPQTLDDAFINFLRGSQVVPAQIGEVTNASGESFLSVSGISDLLNRQPLLWERLLPNPTYTPGILLGLLISVVPLIIFLIQLSKRIDHKLSTWQKLLLYGEMAAFFVVGLVISVKIGGGGDLHNMDMFLVSLPILAGIYWHAGGKQIILNSNSESFVFKALLLLVVLLPGLQGMISAKQLDIPSSTEAEVAVKGIQGVVDSVLPGEILFIDQRQLLTFKKIKHVPLVPEYEKKVLMEMAMADDEQYFDPFIKDMLSHRFSLILSEPLYIYYQGAEHVGGFGSENDLWVKWVSIPILCNYEPIETDTNIKYQLLIPRVNPLKDYEQKPCEEFFDIYK